MVGFAVRRFGIPVLPLILGVIIGPLMEVKMREALDLSNGDISGLFNEGLAVFIYVVIVLALVVPLVLDRVRGTRATRRGEGGAAMTVVVGYIPNAYGEAALDGRHRGGPAAGDRLVVVNATKGDSLVDTKYVGEAAWADLQRTARRAGRPPRGAAGDGPDVADEMLDAAREVDAEADGDRHAAAHAGRQDAHGQRRPAGAARGALPGARGQAGLTSAVLLLPRLRGGLPR